MSSSNPSVFFFFLLLQSLSGSLERILKEIFSSNFKTNVFRHVLVFLIVSMQIEFLDTPEAWVIIFHGNFHGLGFIILSW